MVLLRHFVFVILCVVFVAACSGPSIEGRNQLAKNIASKAKMQEMQIATGNFILTTYYKITDKNAPVNIYIEGDGFAWASRNRLSSNPTPKDAFTLRLASEDNAKNVVYIARPCQYTPLIDGGNCTSKYWSGSRFSEEVVDSINNAVSYYSKRFKKPKINLIGYSGGAAIAALVAERRSDIITLRTVAGNLDHVAVNDYHGVDALDNSLNPSDIKEKLSKVPQYHFAGTDDEIIPLSIIKKFAKTTNQGKACVKFRAVEGATHYSGWANKWGGASSNAG